MGPDSQMRCIRRDLPFGLKQETPPWRDCMMCIQPTECRNILAARQLGRPDIAGRPQGVFFFYYAAFPSGSGRRQDAWP